MKKDLRIVFMGTPEFAVASLQALVEHEKNIVGVITAPDKPKGRGQKVLESPVKTYAKTQGLNVLQPTNLKDDNFLEELKNLKADLQIVVAFRMLPEVVWEMPPMGSFNLHASLLPQYRGAAPINWAIINGETETGVTTFFLQHKIDTGDIIYQEKEPIYADDNVGDLYQRLMTKGAELVLKTVTDIAEGTVSTKPQQMDQSLKAAPKIFKETCEIDWNKTSTEIKNLIRGLSPYPAAWTVLHGKKCKIFSVDIDDKKSTHSPGYFEKIDNSVIQVSTGSGTIAIKELQLEGKKRMKTEDFLRGYAWPEK